MLGGKVLAPVSQSPQENYRAVDIVVSSIVLIFTQIAFHISIVFLKALIGPVGILHRCAQAHTCIHAQKTGIDLFDPLFLHVALLAQPFIKSTSGPWMPT